MPNFHAAPKCGIGDSRAAYLDNEVFFSREECQAEIERLGLADLYEVRDGSGLRPMIPEFPK